MIYERDMACKKKREGGKKSKQRTFHMVEPLREQDDPGGDFLSAIISVVLGGR